MNTSSLSTRLLLIVPLALFTIGCGGGTRPDLGRVSGRITLDGNPIEGVHIEFTPVIDGRPSVASSDSSGYYTLSYKGSIMGARLGEHDVTMTTFREAIIFDEDEDEDDVQSNSDASSDDDDDDDGDVTRENIPGRAEEIPEKYAEEKLRVTVEPGSNTINLELTSD